LIIDIYLIRQIFIVNKKTATLYNSLTVFIVLVDNSIEISNISFTDRDFNATYDQIELLIHKVKRII